MLAGCCTSRPCCLTYFFQAEKAESQCPLRVKKATLCVDRHMSALPRKSDITDFMSARPRRRGPTSSKAARSSDRGSSYPARAYPAPWRPSSVDRQGITGALQDIRPRRAPSANGQLRRTARRWMRYRLTASLRVRPIGIECAKVQKRRILQTTPQPPISKGAEELPLLRKTELSPMT